MRRVCLLIASALILPRLAMAQPAPAAANQGFYVSLGAGVQILQNQTIRAAAPGAAPEDLRFDAGPGAYVSLGYTLGNGLRLELQGDYAHNGVSGVKPSGGGSGGGTEQHYGGFVNLAYDFNLGLPVIPFVGIGAGYQVLDLDHAGGAGGAYPSLSGSNGAFAYEGMAGLSYPVAAIPGLSLTAEYRIVGVLSPSAFERSAPPGESDQAPRPGAATLGNSFNHEALIGLRYNFGAPPPPAPPAPPATEAAPPAPPATRTYLVFFDWDRADLSERARQIVAEAAAASTHVPVTRLNVNGYTDLSGGAAYNQRLSVRRAEAVEAELVRDGVPKAEIVIQGLGESNPLVPTAPGVREPQNRRVEIILH